MESYAVIPAQADTSEATDEVKRSFTQYIQPMSGTFLDPRLRGDDKNNGFQVDPE